VYIEDNTTIGNDLEMHLSERVTCVRDESFKSRCHSKDENMVKAKEKMEDVKVPNQ